MLRRLFFFLSTKRRGVPQTASLSGTLLVHPQLDGSLTVGPALSGALIIRPRLDATLRIYPLDAMTQRSSFVRNSTLLADLVGLVDNATGLYLTDATVTGDLLDPSGQPVTGGANLNLSHVSGTTGSAVTYRGVIPSSVVFGPGVYRFRCVAVDATSNHREFNASKAAVDG